MRLPLPRFVDVQASLRFGPLAARAFCGGARPASVAGFRAARDRETLLCKGRVVGGRRARDGGLVDRAHEELWRGVGAWAWALVRAHERLHSGGWRAMSWRRNAARRAANRMCPRPGRPRAVWRVAHRHFRLAIVWDAGNVAELIALRLQPIPGAGRGVCAADHPLVLHDEGRGCCVGGGELQQRLARLLGRAQGRVRAGSLQPREGRPSVYLVTPGVPPSLTHPRRTSA